MSENTVLDTRITEPAPSASEVEILNFALERARAQFAWKVGDLSAEQLNRRHPPSSMTLGGLVKHLAWAEDKRVSVFLTGEPMGELWASTDRDWPWQSAKDDSPQQLYALWQGAVERSRAVWRTVLAGGGLDRPSVHRLPSGEYLNLRRVLIDCIEENIRHTGHADLIREAIDGRVGDDPPQQAS